jgi:hypothetical protein
LPYFLQQNSVYLIVKKIDILSGEVYNQIPLYC